MITVHSNKNGAAKCGAKAYGSWTFGPTLSDDKKAVNCKRCLGTVKKTVTNVAIPSDMLGKILHTSYGYDMTINKYLKIVKIGPKSAVGMPLYPIVSDDDGMGRGRAVPGGVIKDAKPVTILRKVRDTGYGKPYDYYTADRDTWSTWDGRPNYHNTWD